MSGGRINVDTLYLEISNVAELFVNMQGELLRVADSNAVGPEMLDAGQANALYRGISLLVFLDGQICEITTINHLDKKSAAVPVRKAGINSLTIRQGDRTIPNRSVPYVVQDLESRPPRADGGTVLKSNSVMRIWPRDSVPMLSGILNREPRNDQVIGNGVNLGEQPVVPRSKLRVWRLTIDVPTIDSRMLEIYQVYRLSINFGFDPTYSEFS